MPCTDSEKGCQFEIRAPLLRDQCQLLFWRHRSPSRRQHRRQQLRQRAAPSLCSPCSSRASPTSPIRPAASCTRCPGSSRAARRGLGSPGPGSHSPTPLRYLSPTGSNPVASYWSGCAIQAFQGMLSSTSHIFYVCEHFGKHGTGSSTLLCR